jgi:hypothetical protein
LRLPVSDAIPSIFPSNATDAKDTDLALSPHVIAARDVTMLGADEACARWASISSLHPDDNRLYAIVNAVIDRSYETAPPLDERPVFVVSVFDTSHNRLEDVLICHAPAALVAMRGGLQVIQERGKVKVDPRGKIEVIRVDDCVSVDRTHVEASVLAFPGKLGFPSWT